MGGTLREEQERSRGRLPHPLRAREPAELPGRYPHSKAPSRLHGSWGHRKEAEGRTAEAGGRGPPRREEQERRGGCVPCPLESGKPAVLPGEVPCPLRPAVGGTPGPLLFLEPKPHSPQPPGPFPALWVLSIGRTHHQTSPMLRPRPPQPRPPPAHIFSLLFSFSSSSFLLLWY